VDCEITSHGYFEQQVSKILFPFILSDEELDDLHIENLSLKDLGSCFDSQYEVYHVEVNIKNTKPLPSGGG
jgi:hypothetical protein